MVQQNLMRSDFMEVNDYLTKQEIRVLSSEKEEKMEPDLVTTGAGCYDLRPDMHKVKKKRLFNWKMRRYIRRYR